MKNVYYRLFGAVALGVVLTFGVGYIKSGSYEGGISGCIDVTSGCFTAYQATTSDYGLPLAYRTITQKQTYKSSSITPSQKANYFITKKCSFSDFLIDATLISGTLCLAVAWRAEANKRQAEPAKRRR